MAKKFGGPFDLRPVDVPNWEHLERIERLLKPYADAAVNKNPIEFIGKDSRGMISEPTVDALRLAFDEDERAPAEIEISLIVAVNEFSEAAETTAHVRMSNPYPPSGSARSDREEVATFLKLRLQELFERTNAEEGARRRAEMEEEARRAEALNPQPAVVENVPAPRRGAFLYDSSTQAVGGFVGGILVVVVVAIWAIFFR
jgi:hypothetical protein